MPRVTPSRLTVGLFLIGAIALVTSIAFANGSPRKPREASAAEISQTEAYPGPACLDIFAIVPTSSAIGVATPFSVNVVSNTCGGSVSFSWSFGDGTGSTQPSPTHTYSHAGLYSWAVTGSANGTTATKVGTISVGGPASVAVLSNPKTLMQQLNLSPTSSTFRIVNTGSDPSAVTLTPQGGFFSLSPTSFSLPGGQEQAITVTALIQPAGGYSGSVSIAGTGVPAGLSVPVTMISFVLSAGPQPDVVPRLVRLDLSGSGNTATGTVSFKNVGQAAATGVFVSDQPWLVPQLGVTTILPGATVEVPVTANRLLLGDPSTAAATITTLRFVYPPSQAAGVRSTAGSAGSGSAGLAVSVGFAQPSAQGLPALLPGEVALTLSGLRKVDGSTRLLADLRAINVNGGALPTFTTYLIALLQKAADAQSLSQAGQPSGGITLAAPDVGTSGAFSAHLRGTELSSVLVNAVTMRINDDSRELFQLELPPVRSDRGAGPGQSVNLPGAAFMQSGSCRIDLQEVSGVATTLQISVLGAGGTSLAALPTRAIGAFEAAAETLTLPAGAATIVVRNQGSGGRLFAFATEESENDSVVLRDARYDRESSSTWIVPWVTAYTPVCGSTALCVLNNRFMLTLSARDQRKGASAPGVAIPQNDLFGYYALPGLTGSATNPEVFVKMLDGSAVNGNFWTFFGGLTDLEYTLNVLDTTTGKRSTYVKDAGSPQGGFDVGSGVTKESCKNLPGNALSAVPPSACAASSSNLCLNASRFKVELAARNHRNGDTGAGLSIPQNDLFGYFSIPALTNNPSNPEVFVKVLDGRPVNGNFWVFYGGLTDLEYTITVTDTATGQRKAFFKGGGSSCGGFDVSAFVTGASRAAPPASAPNESTAPSSWPRTARAEAASTDRIALALHNPTTFGASVHAEYWNAAGVMKSQKDLTILAGATAQYSDLFAEWLGLVDAGDGYLKITSTSGTVVPAAYRFGQGSTGTSVVAALPLLPLYSGLYYGQTRSLGPLEDASKESKVGRVPSAFAPTLGLIETQGGASSVEVSVSYAVPRGLALGTVAKKTYPLPAGQVLLIPDVVRDVVGTKRDQSGDLHDVTVSIRNVGGGQLAVFVVSESLATGDASVIAK